MSHRYTLFAAAALAVGGLTYGGCDRNDTASNTSGTSTTSSRTSTTTNPTVGERVDDAGNAIARGADKAGDALARGAEKTKDAAATAGDKLSSAAETAGAKIKGATENAKANIGTADTDNVRGLFASVTEAALTQNGLDDLTERLVDADRNRIGSAIGNDAPDHTALVKQFRADWKAKYGEDFKIRDKQAAYPDGMFQIANGEIPKGAAPTGTEVATGQKPGDLDANREAGRNIATVTIAAGHGASALSVPLIHELPNQWRIDAPDTIDAAKLKSNVMAHLQAVEGMKDQWPVNVQDGYAMVTHHVLEAVMDQPVESSK